MRMIDADALIKKLDDAIDTNNLASMVIVNALITLIAKQSTVTDTNVGCKWIPVSERLPDDGEWVLITYENAINQRIVDYANYFGGHWKSELLWFCNVDVNAWMPLPKPYKESE